MIWTEIKKQPSNRFSVILCTNLIVKFLKKYNHTLQILSPGLLSGFLKCRFFLTNYYFTLLWAKTFLGKNLNILTRKVLCFAQGWVAKIWSVYIFLILNIVNYHRRWTWKQGLLGPLKLLMPVEECSRKNGDYLRRLQSLSTRLQLDLYSLRTSSGLSPYTILNSPQIDLTM